MVCSCSYINLQADFVGVASSFARMCTSCLKVKQRPRSSTVDGLALCVLRQNRRQCHDPWLFNTYWKIFWPEQHRYDLTQPSSTVSLVLFQSCLSMHGLQNWKLRRHACEWVTHNYSSNTTLFYLKSQVFFSNKMKVLIIHSCHLQRFL